MNKTKKYAALLLLTGIILAGCSAKSATSTSTSKTTTAATSSSTSSAVTETAVAVSTSDLFGDYKDEDYDYDTTNPDTTITLSGSTATIEGSGATLKNNVLAISKGGTYALSGDFTGQIEINSTEEVHLIFNGVTLTNTTGAAINIIEAEKVIVTLAKDTENTVTDGADYAKTGEDDPTSAIYSKADLTFNGTGSLTVSGKYKNAIQSKDDLTFIDGTYTIDAVGDGLKGKDKVAILAGTYTIKTDGDAIQATNADEADKGFVAIDGGTFTIESGSDGVQAEKQLTYNTASAKITTTGAVDDSDTASSKGLKAGTTLTIYGGTIDVDATDDALHSNQDLTVEGGTITLSSGDDGMHAENNLTINDGTVKIVKSYEGIEAKTITFNGGTTEVTASDDGVNASAGTSSGGMGGGGMDQSDGSSIVIKGGSLTVDADGDGVDSNGDIAMSGGTVVVNGPTNGGNGALDYAGEFNLTGGTLFAAGSNGMVQSVSTSSTQTNVTFALNNAVEGSTVTLVQNNKTLGTFEVTKQFQVFTFSSADLTTGTLTVKVGSESYDVSLTDTATSVTQDGSAFSSTGMGGGGGMGGGPGGRQ